MYAPINTVDIALGVRRTEPNKYTSIALDVIPDPKDT